MSPARQARVWRPDADHTPSRAVWSHLAELLRPGDDPTRDTDDATPVATEHEDLPQ